MKFKMTDKNRTLTVYHYSQNTFELIGSGEVYIPADTGLPAYCTVTEPSDNKSGYAQVFDDKKSAWSYEVDLRGIYYDKSSGFPVFVSDLGEIPEQLTASKPGSIFDKWDGKKWSTDEKSLNAYNTELANQKKIQLLSQAESQIAILEDAVNLEIETEDEAANLLAWKTYRVLLNRVDTSNAPDIEWPEEPGDVA